MPAIPKLSSSNRSESYFIMPPPVVLRYIFLTAAPTGLEMFGKSPFAFGPTVIAANVGSGQHYYPSSGNANGGSLPDYQPQQQQPHHTQQHHHHHHQQQLQQQQQQQHGEWTPAPTSLPALGGVGADMRGASPAKDSPGHSNRNSAASSDSGRGYSTGHTDAKPTHNYINVHVNNQQHRLSGQSYESGVSSRQSYHSTSSSSLGSLDRLEEPGYTSTINVLQLFQAGVPTTTATAQTTASPTDNIDRDWSISDITVSSPEGGREGVFVGDIGNWVTGDGTEVDVLPVDLMDNEVLHAWLHELGFVEYYPLFYQAGYDMPTISRMTPEVLHAHCTTAIPLTCYLSTIVHQDLTAIGITKPAHRKRLKSEIARLNIHDGIPDYKPNDLMEWLHLLGLGTYLDTLCGQGYDNIDYVTDITWEDLEEIGIQKLGHQKKIMLAIDRLKRITSGGKRLSSVDGRTASLELLEPPPPAPPITGRWSGAEITAIPQHIYDGALGGARPKKSPSGDSISTTSSGNSGSSVGSGGGGPGHTIAAAQGEVRVIPLPREDAGLAGATPYRHNSTGASSGLQPDVVAIQVKRNMRSSTSEDKRDTNGQPLMYHSFQGPTRRSSENDVFADSPGRVLDADDFATYQVALDKRKPISKAMVKSESEKHESEINSDGNKSMYYTATNIKHNHNNNSTVRVDAGEHIYDTPQIIQSQTSTNPMNVSLSGSLHINTDSDCSLPGQSKPVSPGSKGAKKIPPPPPKRTHSIREETTPLSQSAPASPSRNLTAPTTITVSASVHPQPVAIVAKQPPPVMQKPQKPHSPAVANKFHPQTQHVAPLPQQQQQLPQHYHQQPQVSLNPPAVAQKPLSSKPSTAPILIVAAPANSTLQAAHGHSSPHQPAGFAKPKVSIIQPQVQQPAQPKSPLPSKSPMAATIVPKPLHAQQQPPYTSSAHVHAGPHAMSQQPPSPHPVQIAQTGQPQVQAFASCVKSLSEKFGKKTDEEDQFPDNVSTDSDDFPPPPPPIAMDIITPKIHNYGIPSIRGKSDFGIHQRDYGNKARPNHQGPRNFIAPGSAVTGHPRHAGNVMPVMPTPKPSPNLSPAVVGEVQLRKNANALSVTGSSPSSSEHECTPEPDLVKLIGHDKRSESTTSFESNSSIDSNTLPFANENVGTIKQRAANSKPSIVQSMEAEGGQRNVDLNPGVFDNESHRYSNSAPYKSSPSSYSQHIVAGEQTRAPGFNGNMLSPQMQNKLSKQPPSGAIRAAPVPNSKPMLSPKPSRPASGPSESLPPPPPPASTEDSQKPVSSGNVLSDIDDMLQGLTDELDAMLEQEMNSS
ncbi:hypothetical protein Btru_058980 [Bulinus truncatus]|nr:hypothetical protein Btru_058980 [Bulinus truncatus]